MKLSLKPKLKREMILLQFLLQLRFRGWVRLISLKTRDNSQDTGRSPTPRLTTTTSIGYSWVSNRGRRRQPRGRGPRLDTHGSRLGLENGHRQTGKRGG